MTSPIIYLTLLIIAPYRIVVGSIDLDTITV